MQAVYLQAASGWLSKPPGAGPGRSKGTERSPFLTLRSKISLSSLQRQGRERYLLSIGVKILTIPKAMWAFGMGEEGMSFALEIFYWAEEKRFFQDLETCYMTYMETKIKVMKNIRVFLMYKLWNMLKLNSHVCIEWICAWNVFKS